MKITQNVDIQKMHNLRFSVNRPLTRLCDKEPTVNPKGKMIKKIIVLILAIFTLAEIANSQEVTYKAGDTLNVFTIGGLKLRAEALLTGRVLASMKLGEKVVVQDVFQTDNKYFQTIEGFAGHWVKVKYDTLIGYAFDGFLSALPVPRENLMMKEEGIKTKEEIEAYSHYQGQEMESALQEYIRTEFRPICEPVEYYNGSDGEGFHYLKIQKLSSGFTQIHHGGWEGWGTELLMPKVRLSEVKNLIILRAYRSGIDHKLFEEVKTEVKKIPEGKRAFQEILNLEMFWIKIKHYPGENNELKWSLEFDCASS